MYPVVTVLLAAAVLRERLRPPQLAGVVLALGGIAAVAAG
jgi:drug/metabolite transporter (DMT)-like permease